MAAVASWLALVATIALGGLAGGARGAAAGAVVALLGAAWILIVLPRSAHAAFARGAAAAARWRYRVLARLSPTRTRRGAARVSVAATWLAGGDVARATARLAAIDPAALDDAARAAWLNNRACAALAAGADAADALAWVDEAAQLRPDVPGVVHTRGQALLAAGRIDDAIRAFESMWELGDLPPRLEAERCRDLAAAWERKGHLDYAADYRGRAARLWPEGAAAADAAPLASAVLGEVHE